MMHHRLLSRVLDAPVISRVQRNHALEHATLHVLTERQGTPRVVGRASFRGFTIYGDVHTQDLYEAAREGLRRLKAGEQAMAIHPHCGSNYVVAGTLAALGTFLALGGFSRDDNEGVLDRLAHLPMACALGTLGVVLSRPLGGVFQAHVTTQPNVGQLSITSVTRTERAGTAIHTVQTSG